MPSGPDGGDDVALGGPAHQHVEVVGQLDRLDFELGEIDVVLRARVADQAGEHEDRRKHERS